MIFKLVAFRQIQNFLWSIMQKLHFEKKLEK